MTDADHITVDIAIPIPTEVSSPQKREEMFAMLNTDVLRPAREDVRNAGGTSKLRRSESGYWIEFTGPAQLVLDIIESLRHLNKRIAGVLAENRAKRERNIDTVLTMMDEHEKKKRRQAAEILLNAISRGGKK